MYGGDYLVFLENKPENMRMLAQRVDNFPSYLDQRVNFEKSLISFSPKTSMDLKWWVSNTLQIHKQGMPGKYVGLSTLELKKTSMFLEI